VSMLLRAFQKQCCLLNRNSNGEVIPTLVLTISRIDNTVLLKSMEKYTHRENPFCWGHDIHEFTCFSKFTQCCLPKQTCNRQRVVIQHMWSLRKIRKGAKDTRIPATVTTPIMYCQFTRARNQIQNQSMPIRFATV